MNTFEPDLLQLRHAIEMAWRPDTANGQVSQAGNPALGQCYPTARVVQHFWPETEIVEGVVVTPKGTEKHFWNVLQMNGKDMHIDITWQQFPHGSFVSQWKVRDRTTLDDRPQTIHRVELLLERVQRELG